MDAKVVERVVREVKRDLDSGTWEARYGHLRSQSEHDVGLRLVVSASRRGE